MKTMLYANSSISNTINFIIRNLSPEEQLFLPYNPLIKDNDVLRYLRLRNLSFIVMHDYGDMKYRKDHPIKGLVITIAGMEKSEEAGDWDYLIQNAIEDAGLMEDDCSKYLVAEVDEKDKEREKLFLRNDFELAAEYEGIKFYSIKTR